MSRGARASTLFLLASLLAGCGVEDFLDPPGTAPAGPGNPSEYPVFNPAQADLLRSTAEFRFSRPSSGFIAALRAATGLPPECVGSFSNGCRRASPLEALNVHVAHTAVMPSTGKAITGEGELIAVMDAGFNLGHRELAGKSVILYPDRDRLPSDDHGTMVAAIAAAAADGSGMLGVAPGAALHLSSFQVSLQEQADATLDAANRGAVVQNNSWGPADERPASAELADFRASGERSYTDYFGRRYGSPEGLRAYFRALDKFQETGVIVFANSNDENLGDVSSFAALPLFYPSLREAWIVVGNALLEVDNDGKVVRAGLLSAPCGSAAEFCVVADGSVYGPVGGAGGYAHGTGTSFAAPQVAGLIALLAQAFPNLTPGELTTRLLATAQNGWGGFRDSVAGEITFAPGVTRPFSRLYGMGVPDIAAALRPVGTLSMARGENVATAEALSVGGGMLASAPVIGSSIANALAGRSIMLLDALGSDFYRTGSEIGLTGSGSQAPVANVAHQISIQSQSFALGLARQSTSAATADAAAAKLFFSQSLAGASGSRFATSMRLDRTSLLHVAGYVADVPQANSAGVTLSRLREGRTFSTELSVSAGYHQGRVFSAMASGPILGVESTATASASFSATARLGRDWTVSGFAEIGAGSFSEFENALASFGPILHASAGFSAARRNLAVDGDRLSLYAGLRPRAVAGIASIRLPAARDAGGNIRYDTVTVDLASGAGVPARAGLGYFAALDAGTDLSLNLNLDFDATGRDRPEGSASVALRRRF